MWREERRGTTSSTWIVLILASSLVPWRMQRTCASSLSPHQVDLHIEQAGLA